MCGGQQPKSTRKNKEKEKKKYKIDGSMEHLHTTKKHHIKQHK